MTSLNRPKLNLQFCLAIFLKACLGNLVLASSMYAVDAENVVQPVELDSITSQLFFQRGHCLSSSIESKCPNRLSTNSFQSPKTQQLPIVKKVFEPVSEPVENGLQHTISSPHDIPIAESVASSTTTVLNTSSTSKDFIIFPIGLGVNGRIVINSALIRGFENGTDAINFEDWLIPFDSVTRALNIAVTPLENGQWELRTPGLLLQVNPDEIQRDNELGLVISIADIQALLGVPATFDLQDYAVFFSPPWSSTRLSSDQPLNDGPIVTDGLPYVAPSTFTMTFAGQRFNTSGGSDRSTTTRGDLTTLGTLMGGSWFVRLNQSSLSNLNSWSLSEAQYLLETAPADYAIGSQPTFWRSQGDGNYWGLTTIQRWNYEPPVSLGLGGFSPSARLQADAIGRDVVGEAPPGSVVQLVRSSRANIVAEAFVDSAGVYRFENIPQGGLYEVLVYPNGQLTAQPEVRDVSFSTVPSQLPAGASAFVASAGLRQQSSNDFFNGFRDFSGGAAYRQGISDEFTVGAGIIHDEEILGLGELFYQSSNLPIQLAVSALGGGQDGLSMNADFVYQPSSRFRLDLNTDDLSSRFRANWQVFPNLGLRATGNTRDEAFGVGFTGYLNNPNFSALAIADYLTNGNFRWNARVRYDRFELNSQGNEVGSNSNMLLRLTEGRSFTEGHFLRMGYATQGTVGNGSLFTAGWRYQSNPRAADGRYLWAINAGYGMGSEGNGPIASIETAIIPGPVLRARYEGVSATTGESAFAIELLPFYNLQANRRSNDSRYEYFRRQGGLWIQPFIDTNANGILDEGEVVFVEDSELLMMLDNQPIERYQPLVDTDGLLVRTIPGMHRLDLDPAGYPLNLRPAQVSYAVDVVAGSYTPIAIPFTVTYTVAGIVTDAAGQPLGNATVEAIPTDGGLPIIAVTNHAGIYYLDNLEQTTYRIQVNQKAIHLRELTINANSDTFQEVNLIVQPSIHCSIAIANRSCL